MFYLTNVNMAKSKLYYDSFFPQTIRDLRITIRTNNQNQRNAVKSSPSETHCFVIKRHSFFAQFGNPECTTDVE